MIEKTADLVNRCFKDSKVAFIMWIVRGPSGTNSTKQGGVGGHLSDPKISQYPVLTEVVFKKNSRNQ